MKVQNLHNLPKIFPTNKDVFTLKYDINGLTFDMQVCRKKTRKNSKVILKNNLSNVETTWRDFAELYSYLWARNATDIEVN